LGAPAIDRKYIDAMSRYSYLGIFFGVAVVLGLVVGRWVDRRYHTDPWGGFVGILVGVVAGFRELYRVSKQALKDQK
jgi:ATP synthase protein I